MNKKLLSAAIAAAIAAPTAALANDVTIYGVIHASVDYRTDSYTYREQDPRPPELGGWFNTYVAEDNGQYDGFDVASRATRLGFKGTEDLANGLKAIWKIEAQADIADLGGACFNSSTVSSVMQTAAWKGSASIGSPTVNQGGANGKCSTSDWWSARNAYVGLAGGWGTFLVGRHDTPYKMSTGKLDLFADTLADYNSMIGFVDIRTNSAIAYVSPSWSGLSFAGAIVAPHVWAGSNSKGASTADADSLAEAYSLALTYDNAGFFGSVAYESISGTWFDAITECASCNADDNGKWRFGLGWTGAGFTIGGIYEMESAVAGFDGLDADRWQIQAGYTFGNNMIKAMYGQGDWDSGSWSSYSAPGGYYRERYEGDSSAWAIGLDHNFSKRTKAYVLYTNMDYNTDWNEQVDHESWDPFRRSKEDGDSGGFSVGMIHSF